MQQRTFLILFLALSLFTEAQVESRMLSPMPDQARDDAVGFTIDGIGYIQGGRKTDFSISDQLWAYDPTTDVWESKAPLPALPRQYASSFILDGKAYLIGGAADPGLRISELWQYDSASDAWTQLADFPGGERYAMSSFVYQGVAYAGLGKGYDEVYSDLWKYDPSEDSWEEFLQFPEPLFSAINFQLNGLVYIGTGQDGDDLLSTRIWSFDGASLRAVNGYPYAVTSVKALMLESTPLLVGGKSETNPAVDGYVRAISRVNGSGFEQISWNEAEQIAGGEVRNGAVFSIGKKGYYFGGKDGMDVRSNDLIEFSIASEQPQISISPNPYCFDLLIESEEAFETLRVYTRTGKLVLEKKLNEPVHSIALSLNELSIGTYIIQAGEQQVETVVRLCGF
jgi:hypothetical protein